MFLMLMNELKDVKVRCFVAERMCEQILVNQRMEISKVSALGQALKKDAEETYLLELKKKFELYGFDEPTFDEPTFDGP